MEVDPSVTNSTMSRPLSIKKSIPCSKALISILGDFSATSCLSVVLVYMILSVSVSIKE